MDSFLYRYARYRLQEFVGTCSYRDLYTYVFSAAHTIDDPVSYRYTN